MNCEMEFTLPSEPAATLIKKFEEGKEGIKGVVKVVAKVDAEHAQATVKADEITVRAAIENSIGFDEVNDQVRGSITAWIAKEFKEWIDSEIERDLAEGDPV